ncbi:hypothetical protein IGI37_003575 [Enterococcus sp. AZ194]
MLNCTITNSYLYRKWRESESHGGLSDGSFSIFISRGCNRSQLTNVTAFFWLIYEESMLRRALLLYLNSG